MSHRHADHMGGLDYVLRVNPKVKIYAPKENFGVYGFSLPSSFYRKDESLPPEQRYYDGAPPEVMKFGSAWPKANFELIEKTTEIAPGIHLIALVSDKPTTLELRELSLAIDTPDGIVLVVGCSHPGIDKIVEAASSINKRIHIIAGGFHLVVAKDPDIETVVTGLHDTWKVDYVAPGHCTGEPTFAALRKAFGEHYVYAGLGSTIYWPPRGARLLRQIRQRPVSLVVPGFQRAAFGPRTVCAITVPRFSRHITQTIPSEITQYTHHTPSTSFSMCAR
jgi:7,8-dihydropterin-6-yl-methyl-4-(beta-D-ribofuranosyl)aminobenzene 5'-phosphate synthase